MFQYKCMNNISDAIHTVLDDQYKKTDETEEADGIIVRSAKMHDMEFGDRLKAIVRAGSGVNNIPLERCAEEGIVVFNSPGANANSVKELVIGSMINASRNIPDAIRWVKDNAKDEDLAKDVEKGKKKFAGTELKSKTLGVIGLGAIGGMVANAAYALGMHIVGIDPYLSVRNALALDRSVKIRKTYGSVYSEADYLTIHLHLTDQTRGMINSEAFDQMKDGVILMNFSRGEVVDNIALKEALESGKVRKYVTDFPSPEVMKMPNVIATPHLGASTKEAEDNCAIMAVEELRDYLENGCITNSVNYPNVNPGPCQSEGRVVVLHHNVPNVLSTISTVFGGKGINITNLTNQTRGKYACCVVDTEAPVTKSLARELCEADSVIRVIVVK